MVLATHEQILGGDDGQVYQGCPFPGQTGLRHAAGHVRPACRAASCRAPGDRGAEHRLCGSPGPRSAVAALRPRGESAKGRRHPAHRRYCPVCCRAATTYGRWRHPDGWRGTTAPRTTSGTRGGPGYPGPARRSRTLRRPGVRPSNRDRCGAHMLSSIAIDGRFGMTAVGGSAQEAERLLRQSAPW